MSTRRALRSARAVFMAVALSSVIASGFFLLHYNQQPSGVELAQEYLASKGLRNLLTPPMGRFMEHDPRDLYELELADLRSLMEETLTERGKDLAPKELAELQALIEGTLAKREAELERKYEQDRKRARESRETRMAEHEKKLAKGKDELAKAAVVAKKAEQEKESTIHAATLAFFSSLISVLGLISTNLLAWRKEGRDSRAARLEIEKQALALEKERIAIQQQLLELEKQKAATNDAKPSPIILVS